MFSRCLKTTVADLTCSHLRVVQIENCFLNHWNLRRLSKLLIPRQISPQGEPEKWTVCSLQQCMNSSFWHSSALRTSWAVIKFLNFENRIIIKEVNLPGDPIVLNHAKDSIPQKIRNYDLIPDFWDRTFYGHLNLPIEASDPCYLPLVNLH